MRTLQEWKAYFVNLGLGEDAANTAAQDAVKDAADAVGAEKEKGITEYNKKDRETLALKNKLKDAGYNKDTHGSPEEFLAGLNKSLEEFKTSSDGNKTELQKALERSQKLEDRLDETDRQAKKKQDTANKATKTSKLTTALAGKLASHEVHVNALLNDESLTLNDAGDLVASVDGKDVDFAAFTKSYLEKHKGSQIVDQKNGSGLGGNNNAGVGNEVIDLSQFEGKSVEEIQADMPAARAALGLKK